MNFTAIGPKILTMTDKLCYDSYNKRIFLNRLIQHMRQGGLRKSVLPLFLSFSPPHINTSSTTLALLLTAPLILIAIA